MTSQNGKGDSIAAEAGRTESTGSTSMDIEPNKHLFPFCIVWTPIPCITWFLPFVGHMGIATSRGIIRDFAGSFYVSENEMAFGWPTRYLQLNVNEVDGGPEAYDRAVKEASDEYKCHTHNLLCDNCHSHVALALNTMRYKGRTDWKMVNLATETFFKGKFINVLGVVQQFLPLMLILIGILLVVLLL
ncbi:hypothetical protein WR25_01555 [Diploscapter pachys]|uniref:Transmembrane protein 222 n=1 Tax=Diploscapter pachys TaxID=2018661 RepID=A0A2A2K5R3_9BILA|nr:hypothetical protein WR25_01555 [Diploscapter pachys]